MVNQYYHNIGQIKVNTCDLWWLIYQTNHHGSDRNNVMVVLWFNQREFNIYHQVIVLDFCCFKLHRLKHPNISVVVNIR